jgi:hypothetical protein
MTFKNLQLAGSSSFDIGSGLLLFGITPADVTSPAARTMLVADRIRADAFDIGADPESGYVGPSEVATLEVAPPRSGQRLEHSCVAYVDCSECCLVTHILCVWHMAGLCVCITAWKLGSRAIWIMRMVFGLDQPSWSFMSS